MTRNERIVEAYKSHSLEQVGEMFGLSREGARKIIKRLAPDFKKVIQRGLVIPQELIDSYINKKIKLKELAKKLKSAADSVSAALKKAGAKIYLARDYSEERDNLIVEKYKQMMSLQEIADELDIAVMTVRNAISLKAPKLMRRRDPRENK